TRNPCGGPPTSPPRMLTRTTSKKAAPIRSQKLALGNAQASGRLATAAPLAPGASGGIVGGANPSPPADCGGGAEAVAGCGSGAAAKLALAGAGLVPGATGVIGGTAWAGAGGADGFSGCSRRKLPKAAMTAVPNPHTLIIPKVTIPKTGIM